MIYLIGNNNNVDGNEMYNNAGGGIISVLDCSVTFDHGNTIIRYNTVSNNDPSVPGMYLRGDCGQTSAAYHVYNNLASTNYQVG